MNKKELLWNVLGIGGAVLTYICTNHQIKEEVEKHLENKEKESD